MTTSFCSNGCDCSCCYGYTDQSCHCFADVCNCGGGPADHGKTVTQPELSDVIEAAMKPKPPEWII